MTHDQLPLATWFHDWRRAREMRAALEHLAEHEGRKVAVLGDMAELGPAAPEYHRAVGELVQSLGIDAVLSVGERDGSR